MLQIPTINVVYTNNITLKTDYPVFIVLFIMFWCIIQKNHFTIDMIYGINLYCK